MHIVAEGTKERREEGLGREEAGVEHHLARGRRTVDLAAASPDDEEGWRGREEEVAGKRGGEGGEAE
jgi:hypothetical protein